MLTANPRAPKRILILRDPYIGDVMIATSLWNHALWICTDFAHLSLKTRPQILPTLNLHAPHCNAVAQAIYLYITSHRSEEHAIQSRDLWGLSTQIARLIGGSWPLRARRIHGETRTEAQTHFGGQRIEVQVLGLESRGTPSVSCLQLLRRNVS